MSAKARHVLLETYARPSCGNGRDFVKPNAILRVDPSTSNRIEEIAMDWNRVEGNWKQIKGNIKEQWGKLTDDDLDVIAGR
jgi:hypothetical protein